MADIIKTGLKLFVITVIAAVCMGVTNLATKGPIEQQRINTEKLSRRAALPQAEDFSQVNIISESAENEAAKIIEINAGKSGNEIVGYTFKISARGYGGDIEIIVGINSENEIEAVQIGEHGETPGLGAKIKEKSFLEQYHGKETKTPLSAVKTLTEDGDADASSSATVEAEGSSAVDGESSSTVDAESSSTVDESSGATQATGNAQEIQAISGATVTSGAVTRGINLASQYYQEVLQSGGGEQ